MSFRWLRRLVRNNTHRIEENTAHVWKRRLSLAYGFLAWNAFAFVGYAMYTGKRDWASYHGLEVDKATPAVQFSRMMDIPKCKVIRINGLERVEEYEIDNTAVFDHDK